jgi:tetratricopeptide (TPR) repeat protein
MERGAEYERRGQTGPALREYRSARTTDPENPYPYFAMGNVYLAMGHYLKAEDNFQRAIELDPEVGVFYNNLGWVYIETNRPVMASGTVRRGLALDLERPYVYLDTLGVVETILGNFAEAESFLLEAEGVIPLTDYEGLSHIYNHQIDLYMKTGEERKGDEARRKLRALGPFHFPRPYYYR